MKIRSNGFTLLETLVILAILSLLAGIAFPAVDRAMRGQAFVEAAARFGAALHAARAQALRRGSTVRFAISGDRRGFGYGDTVDRLPDTVRAALPDGAIAFFADGSASGGRVAIADRDRRWTWAVRPTTGAIERVQ